MIPARYLLRLREGDGRAMKKTIATFKTDKEVEDFVATADLRQVMRFDMKFTMPSPPPSAQPG
jgi:hypothetical protein